MAPAPRWDIVANDTGNTIRLRARADRGPDRRIMAQGYRLASIALEKPACLKCVYADHDGAVVVELCDGENADQAADFLRDVFRTGGGDLVTMTILSVGSYSLRAGS